MREIEFRAWNIVTKTMIDLKKITPLALGIDTDGLFIPFSDGLILMQYTGLKDKNGVKDWIDDIVEAKVGQITYRRRIFQADSGAFCIKLPSLGTTDVEGEPIMLITCPHINIGCVHESPELMETK